MIRSVVEEVLVIDLLYLVGLLRPYADTVVEEQGSQARAIDEDDLVLDPYDIVMGLAQRPRPRICRRSASMHAPPLQAARHCQAI
jgi:hypothetical protein